MTDDPFLFPFEVPTDDELAQDAERERLIAECAARPTGHAWQVEGIPEETPFLRCTDCAAHSDDLMPDILDVLDGVEYEIGGRKVLFGQPLDGVQSNYFEIPVNVEIRISPAEPDYWGGSAEPDIEILIADRPAAEPEPAAAPLWVLCDPCGVMVRTPHSCPASAPTCPTPAGNSCGICPADVLLQEQAEAARALAAEALHGSPSDLDHP